MTCRETVRSQWSVVVRSPWSVVRGCCYARPFGPIAVFDYGPRTTDHGLRTIMKIRRTETGFLLILDVGDEVIASLKK
ncbi:MAG: hypothetical protein AABN33_16285, partial [Acidobacteriota bacterium]